MVGSAPSDSLMRTVVKIFRTRFVVENGVSSTKSVASLRIPVTSGAVRDLKFIDDRSLMLAFIGADGIYDSMPSLGMSLTQLSRCFPVDQDRLQAM